MCRRVRVVSGRPRTLGCCLVYRDGCALVVSDTRRVRNLPSQKVVRCRVHDATSVAGGGCVGEVAGVWAGWRVCGRGGGCVGGVAGVWAGWRVCGRGGGCVGGVASDTATAQAPSKCRP